MKTLAILFTILFCIFFFPIFIGLIGGFFGLVAGILGAVFGIISGIFGAIFGLIGGIFGWVFDCPSFGFFHWNGFTIAALIIIVFLISRNSRQKSNS